MTRALNRLSRIAEMVHQAEIHLILGTQRPYSNNFAEFYRAISLVA